MFSAIPYHAPFPLAYIGLSIYLHTQAKQQQNQSVLFLKKLIPAESLSSRLSLVSYSDPYIQRQSPTGHGDRAA